MARTQQTRRQTRKGSKRMPNEERKANILQVYSKLRWLPDQAEGLYEDYTTKEVDTTEHAAASTPKDAIDIDSKDDKDNEGEYEDYINANTPDGSDVEDNNTLHPREVRKQGHE